MHHVDDSDLLPTLSAINEEYVTVAPESELWKFNSGASVD